MKVVYFNSCDREVVSVFCDREAVNDNVFDAVHGHRMNRFTKITLLCLSILVFGYAGLGHVLGKSGDEKTYRSLTVYSEVLQKIQQDYVDTPNMHLVTAGSLHGMLESLDAQSGYLTPREYTEYKQKLQDRGVGESGLTLSKRYGYIIVVSVLPDSAAQKAGIHSADIFESIGGFTTRDMSVGQALNLLSGAPGTGIKLSVIRRGSTDPQDVEIVREKLAPQKIVTARIEPDTLVLRLPALDAGRAAEVRERLLQAEKQGLRKVILDVRDCGRGEVSEAIALAQLFVPSGTLATLQGQTVSRQAFAADSAKVVWKHPVSVLISTTTAGAAEVFASAIAANHRGDVVGERTFGLASEQKLIPLEDGSAIILTVANYANRDGKPILEEGVLPTEVVRAAADAGDGDLGDDETAAPAAKEAPAEPRPLSPEDPILRKALELLKAPAKKAA
jgi:carboxyl-terminal processing protease